MSKASLLALADRIQTGKQFQHHYRDDQGETNIAIAEALGVPLTVKVGHEALGNERMVPRILRDYVGSLDDALTVMPPGPFWTWIVSKEGVAVVTDMTPRIAVGDDGKADLLIPYPRYQAGGCQSAARALCVAALRARASMEEA